MASSTVTQHGGPAMKQVKGLGGWIRSAIWLELIIPGYFFGKTFGTADAKFRFLDTFMYPPLFINICGYFRDLPAGYYAGRFCGVLAGASDRRAVRAAHRSFL